MPGQDGTGPMGAGPITGRGMGNCGRGLRGAGQGLGMGRGMGSGCGMGLGRRQGNQRFMQEGPVGGQDRSELESLKAQVQELKETITQFIQKKETI